MHQDDNDFATFDDTCPVCGDDGASLPLTVCRSAAGWYVGQFCRGCGPYSRESGYFATYAGAEACLRDIEAEAKLLVELVEAASILLD